MTETYKQFTARLAEETQAAYAASPFSALSRDYFNRFHRDPDAVPEPGEILIDSTWRICIPSKPDALTIQMAEHLRDFLSRRMGLELEITSEEEPKCVMIANTGGGTEDAPNSYTISIEPDRVLVRGRDSEGLRDGIVRLVDMIGFRQAPILPLGQRTYSPRLKVRLGAVPWMGSYKDLVFMGHNAAFVSRESLYALSTSDAIPELAARRKPGALDELSEAIKQARQYGLKTYCILNTTQKFPSDDPVLLANPEIRGALTWKADGEYTLCTEHPLVKRYLMESVEGVFRACPDLDGFALIVGGEGFYHCFMKPYGADKGHTNCPRCEPLGAETVVSNLCNNLAEAARKFNPKAEVIAWPYSAEYVWSKDHTQSDFISKLNPGTAIFTEIEKSEFLRKPDGFDKHIWDYSIDLIGPGNRAKTQIRDCHNAGISIYVKSEPELAFEAPRLPQIPCMDRWLARAEALASCGADGAWVFPYFRPNFGTSAAECYKYQWWEPVSDREQLLLQLASRIAGKEAGIHLRNAWRHVSDAIEYSPELPGYYTGPYYLGPAHPMCVDPEAELPQIFYGRYLFRAEINDAEGMLLRPTYIESVGENAGIFGRYYRNMEHCLKQAVDEIGTAELHVPADRKLTFSAETSPTRWFYHTARTHANFYESCILRDQLLELSKKQEISPEEKVEAARLLNRWRQVLLDEQKNSQDALPVARADMRLDFYYGLDHSMSHTTDMIHAKLEILECEIRDYLPALAAKLGI